MSLLAYMQMNVIMHY